MQEPIDYNHCTVLRCFQKNDKSNWVDVPIASGTSPKTRSAILKNADALVFRHLRMAQLNKYDYYIILRKYDGVIYRGTYPFGGKTEETKWNRIDNTSILHDHAGGDRNAKHVCYFNDNYELEYTYTVTK